VLIEGADSHQEGSECIAVPGAASSHSVVRGGVRVELVVAVRSQRLPDVHELLLEVPSKAKRMPAEHFVQRGAEVIVRDRELEYRIGSRAESAYATGVEPGASTAAVERHVGNAGENRRGCQIGREAQRGHVKTQLALRLRVFIMPGDGRTHLK